MIDQTTFEHLLPVACQWAKAQEEFILARGIRLGPNHLADAVRAGVKNGDLIRALVVDRVPLPDDRELAEAARRSGIIDEDTRCMGFGYALIIRGDAWGDRELILHNLVHIAQCERSGGLDNWVRLYLGDRTFCPNFSVGSFEKEARRIAREICQTEAAA